MVPVKLAGVASCLPEGRVASADLERQYGLPEGWIVQNTGVRERRRAGPGDSVVTLAAAASRAALARAGLTVADVSLLVGASGPYQLIPCTAAFVQRELGAADGGSACFDVNTTCTSFLAALDAAAHLIAAGRHAHALIFSSEITQHVINPQEPGSAVLLGDGAAAAVLAPSGPGDTGRLWGVRLATHSSGADLTVCLGGGSRHPPNRPDTTPEMNLFHMNGPAVYRMAGRLLPSFLESFLAEVGWARDDVDWLVPHQASGPGLDLLTRRCGFPAERVVRTVERHGNCAAASLPLALAEEVADGRIVRGQRLLLVATGAGLTLGAAALTY
jgi:3-oxoacyl-[acyl-carrier-protein] synthase-3